jgi:hypothetical protein
VGSEEVLQCDFLGSDLLGSEKVLLCRGVMGSWDVMTPRKAPWFGVARLNRAWQAWSVLCSLPHSVSVSVSHFTETVVTHDEF